MSSRPTKNIEDICKMMDCDKITAKGVLDKGVSIGALKKVSDTEYEITEIGVDITHKINSGYMGVDASTWKCSKCGVVNNILNGPKCFKCKYSYEDSMASDILKKEASMNYKFPKVTDREMMIFLVGNITGSCMSAPTLKNKSFAHIAQHRNAIATIMAKLTIKITDQFPHVSNDEFNEVLLQLNAVRTGPFIEEAVKKMRESL